MAKSTKFTVAIVAAIMVIILPIVLLYAFRAQIISNLLSDGLVKLEQKYGIKVTYSHLDIVGLSTINLHDVTVYSPSADTLAYVAQTRATIQQFSILNRKVSLRELQVNRAIINADIPHKSDSADVSTAINPDKQSLAERANYMVGLALRLLPERISVTDVVANVKRDSFYMTVEMPQLEVIDDQFSSMWTIREMDGEPMDYDVSGTYDRSGKQISANVGPASSDKVRAPFLEYKLGAKIEADMMRFELSVDPDDDELQLRGNVEADGLTIYHGRLSDRTLSFGSPSVVMKASISKNSIEIDSSTVVSLGNLSVSPYVYLEKDTALRFAVIINKDRFPADDLFSSIPEGLMPRLDGMKVTGDIDYHLLFRFDTSRLDSLEFSSSMKRYPGFKILKQGAVPLTMLNDTFTYTAYEDGHPAAYIKIADSNPTFRHLADISPYLQHATLFSEDPSFFRHHGFLESALRESMIKNIKEKRFARGGSTISMQLVKNVFLNRNKNLLRKAEEALIVWLIENNQLCSKERMYEVYMNVIELGPGTYGAAQGSQFYFGKEPKDLTPSEAIFMAMIIPRPKKFMYCFDSQGKLRESYSSYFATIAERMKNAGIISEREANKVSIEEVKITGAEALKYMKLDRPASSVKDDEEETEETGGFFRRLFKRRSK